MRSLLDWIFHSRLLFALTLAVIFYGLFLASNGDEANRTWNEIWNLGHIGAFWIGWTFVFRLFPHFSRMSFLRLLVVVVSSTLVLAEVIEIVQGWIGRDDELQDVWDSGVGALLALGFSAVQTRELGKKLRIAWRTVVLVSLLIIPWTIWSNLADSVIVQRQFPVLCNFTTPFEMTRWQHSRAELALRSPAQQRPYMSVVFHPGLFSTVTLKYFKRDWHAYKRLVLDVANPDKQTFNMVLRIHDRWHKQHHFAYSDRFNRLLVLKPGRHSIVIKLADVAKAPKTRTMDMRHLAQLSLFTMSSRAYHHLYVYRIYLE